jgi:hypothetical protein
MMMVIIVLKLGEKSSEQRNQIKRTKISLDLSFLLVGLAGLPNILK